MIYHDARPPEECHVRRKREIRYSSDAGNPRRGTRHRPQRGQAAAGVGRRSAVRLDRETQEHPAPRACNDRLPRQSRQICRALPEAREMTDYLTLPEVLAVHADQIARYGGRPGVRGPGHLEAALFRPKTGHYADVIEEAAALWESLAQYHPFIDANERTAFASTYTFLTINSLRLQAT